MVATQQEKQPVGRRKLGGGLKSPVLGIKSLLDLLIRLVQNGYIKSISRIKRKGAVQADGNAVG